MSRCVRLVSAVALVTLVAVGTPLSGGAQDRPKFAGGWVLVPDKSVPATAAHQGEITITQDDSTLSLTRSGVMNRGLVVQGGQATAMSSENTTYALAYVFDAADHPSPTAPLPPGANPAMVMRSTTQSTYRAIWTVNQLVIITTETRQPDRNGYAVRRTGRLVLSIDSEGLLVMESISVIDPAPGGPTQPTPTPIRSVYKRASAK